MVAFTIAKSAGSPARASKSNAKIGSMEDSMPQAQMAAPEISIAGWRNAVAWVCAVLLGILFLSAGLWKLTDHLTMATLMVNALAPPKLSVAGAIGFGIAETFGGILLMIPRYRRWGALICGGLLVVFLGYMGWNYAAPKGLG